MSSIKAMSALVLAWCMFSVAAPAGLALPEGRMYEMVSPVFKGGYSINNIVAVAPDGERIAFVSLGAFAGDPANNALTNDYVGRRKEGVGWLTVPLLPPAAIAASSEVNDFSPVVDSTISTVHLGPNFGGGQYSNTENEYLLHSTDAPDTVPNAPDPAPNFEVAGMTLKDVTETPFDPTYEGASADSSHIVLSVLGAASQQLLPEAAKTESHLYDLMTGTGGGERSLKLVGLNNKGKVVNAACQVSLGLGSLFNAVSADGSEIFFSTSSGGCGVAQLFVRLGATRTLEISRPLSPVCHEVPCAGAGERKSSSFRGASQDGSKVFFTSREPLVPGNTDASNNLYMATIGCPVAEPRCGGAGREVTGLVQASRDQNGIEPAEVREVVAIAPDGSHVYFLAKGDLLDSAERAVLAGQGHAVPRTGADNLYVYDSLTGTTGFIADLCSGPELSGTAEDIHCPADLSNGESTFERNDTPLWIAPEREAQVNMCELPRSECVGNRETGRFLVFSSYAQLTQDDTDAGKDIYRYDTVAGTLERVSSGEDTYDANGNDSTFSAAIAKSTSLTYPYTYAQRDMDSRAVSDDGSRIVFTTAEPLSALAGNGLANAYEWDEGHVSVISSGDATQPVSKVLISSSGRDVFFTTTQGLVSQDTDGQADVYDARMEGGFPPVPASPESCSGDACQGPLATPVPLLVPSSVVQTPGENLSPPKKATPKKKAKAPHKKAKRKQAARRAKSTLTHHRVASKRDGNGH
jgi:hypothetical protein